MAPAEKIQSFGTQLAGDKPRYATLLTFFFLLALLIQHVNHSDVVTETDTLSKNPDQSQEGGDENGMFYCIMST